MAERTGRGKTDSEDDLDSTSDAFLRGVAHAPPIDPPVALAAGCEFGRFRVLREIGRGGMGVVYLAHDPALDRDVALKVMALRSHDDGDRVRRFLRESKSAARIVHPNVATVFDAGEFQNHLFLAMEHIRGTDLRRYRGDRALRPQEAVRIVRCIACALSKAHSLGIVHRDIKPENIMLDVDGQVKVLDFGLAKLRGNRGGLSPGDTESYAQATAEGRIVGTPGYMSPEQARGEQVDHRSDIFNVGLVLYELVAGRPVFGGKTALDKLAAITRDDPPPLEFLPRLDSVAKHCLAKDREQRFGSCDDIIAELDALPAGELAAPPGQPGAKSEVAATSQQHSGSSQRARPWLLLVAALGLAGAAALAVLALTRSRRADTRFASEAPALSTTPLARPDAILACPPLEGRGVQEPTTWFGAAASDLACRLATFYLGGREQSTLVPAELLGVSQLIDTLPADLYAAPDVRSRALDAAKLRGDAWLDGWVGWQGDKFAVHLEVRDKSGQRLAEADASRGFFHQAVAAAVDALVERGGLPSRPLEAEPARLWMTTDPKAAATAFFLDVSTASSMTMLPFAQDCASWDEHRGAFRNPAPYDAMCQEARQGSPDGIVIKLDESSPESLAWTFLVAARYGSDLDVPKIYTQLRAAFDGATTPDSRGVLGMAAVSAAAMAGQDYRPLLVRVTQLDPRDMWAWASYAGAVLRQPEGAAARRAAQVWVPWAVDHWNQSTFAYLNAPLEDRITAGLRAVTLVPQIPLFAANVASPLLEAGRVQDVRGIAAQLAAIAPQQTVGVALLQSRADAHEGNIEPALTHLLDALEAHTRLADLPSSDVDAVGFVLDLATLLGRREAAADRLANRFVLASPPRLNGYDTYTSYAAALICLYASRSVSRRCTERLRQLDTDGFIKGHSAQVPQLVEGLGAYHAGDIDKMVKAWRSLPEPMKGATRRAELLDEVGRDDVAATVEHVLSGQYFIRGVTLMHVRQAMRAEQDHDYRRARELAQSIVDAWSRTDAEVPAVAEMRRLLRRLPP